MRADDSDLVEVEASRVDAFNQQIFQGSGADELFVTTANVGDQVNARGGDDTIVVEEDADSNQFDLVNTGRGSDTIVLGENAQVITRSDGFDAANDVFDFSDVEGVDSFDDISFDFVSNEESNDNGEFFGISAGSVNVLLDEELFNALSEDNFVFADDDDEAAANDDEDDEDEDDGAEEEVAEEEDEEEDDSDDDEAEEEEEDVAEDDDDDDDEDDLNVIDQDDAIANGDVLQGTDGDDLILSGGEIVDPGDGDDIISTDSALIFLEEDDGADTIRLEAADGQPQIAGFEVGEDKIDLSRIGAESFDDLNVDEIAANESNAGTIVTFGDAEVRLREIDPDAIDEDDFVFADDDAAVA